LVGLVGLVGLAGLAGLLIQLKKSANQGVQSLFLAVKYKHIIFKV
jgi:hypothetical protein